MLPTTSGSEVGSAGAGVSGMLSSCGTAGSSEAGVASGSAATTSGVAGSGGRATVSGRLTPAGTVTDAGAGTVSSEETGIAPGNKPTTPGSIATLLEDGWIGVATSNDDAAPTNGMPVDEGKLRRRTGLEGTAPVRGSNTGPLIRPASDNGAKVRVGAGLTDGSKPRAMELEGTGLKGGDEGSKIGLEAGLPLITELKIAAGKTGVESCTDGEACGSREGAAKLIGADWMRRFGDRVTGWIAVANELTAEATTDRRKGAGCADDAVRVGGAGAPDEACEVARGRVSP